MTEVVSFELVLNERLIVSSVQCSFAALVTAAFKILAHPLPARYGPPNVARSWDGRQYQFAAPTECRSKQHYRNGNKHRIEKKNAFEQSGDNSRHLFCSNA